MIELIFQPSILEINGEFFENAERIRYRSIEEKALNYLGAVVKVRVNTFERPGKIWIIKEDLESFMMYNAHHMYIEGLIYGDVDEAMTKELKSIFEPINNSQSHEIEKKFPEQRTMKDIFEY